MAEAEIIVLREALHKQAQSIQELTAELEEERKAASSGADEALSMILRLQEEKAMEKMVACQYKRIAEAKLEHAEESLEFLKEAMFQKEMEVANLNLQVQSYSQKLFFFGIVDSQSAEICLSNPSKLCRSNTIMGATGCLGRVRWHIPLPSSCFENLKLEKEIIYRDEPSICAESSTGNKAAECSQQLKEHGRKMDVNKTVTEDVIFDPLQSQEGMGLFPAETDERVISVSVPANNRSQLIESGSSFSGDKPAKSSSYKKKNYLECKEKQYFSNSFIEEGSIGNTAHSTSVLDKFEVPRSSHGNAMNEPQKLDSWSAAVQVNKKAKVPFTLLDPTAGSPADDLINKSSRSINKARKHVIMKSRVPTNPRTCQSDFNQLKERVQKLENEQQTMKEEQSKRHNEQMNLLGQIHGQLNVVQPQRKVSKYSVLSQQDQILLLSVMEAILSFSL